MDCPKCKHDLTRLETFDNIYEKHACPGCGTELYLHYEEDCYEDTEGNMECYDMFEWRLDDETS
jgi:hypothetical protein